jgi:hypothetical protein
MSQLSGIKQRISDAFGVPVGALLLFGGESELQDENKGLKDYGFNPGVQLECHLEPSVGRFLP